MGEQHTPSVTRRGFLRGAVGVSALAVADTTRAQAGTTHTVDMTDTLVFDPAELIIAPGDTVEWVNVGNVGHSVTAYEDQIPADAEYFASGGFASETAARTGYPEGDIGGGGSYSHTFEVVGTYEYFCIPHEGVGMVGTIEVREGGAPAVEETGPVLPDSAKGIAIATMSAMLAVLGLAYVFLKYGGDYGEGGGGEGGGAAGGPGAV
ncbi:plastocyanin/azurin family copper-binding protein [Haloarchaeobius amylolyticus]|uniref:plastocyanin/azurin family copper-binding protein n=1 Tax=Haloarchaeobius amylolyticus TaxID=1198296 RepID=UPI002271B260|nr:plastocyanin/azurin family copper-binding protein [Haloarchaeobius amylolyticus]